MLKEAPPGNHYVLTRFPYIEVLRLALTCPWCEEEMTATPSLPVNIPPFCQLSCRAIWQRIKNDEAIQEASYLWPWSRLRATMVQMICSSVTLPTTTEAFFDQLSDEDLAVLFIKHRHRVKAGADKIAETRRRKQATLKKGQEESDGDGDDEGCGGHCQLRIAEESDGDNDGVVEEEDQDKDVRKF
jgi:hypothetical protein